MHGLRFAIFPLRSLLHSLVVAKSNLGFIDRGSGVVHRMAALPRCLHVFYMQSAWEIHVNMQRAQQFFLTVFILLLPGIGYIIMRGLIYVIPVSNNNALNITIFAAMIIFFGLAIPIWIIKLGIHAASIREPHEPEIKFRNITKDQERLTRSQQH